MLRRLRSSKHVDGAAAPAEPRQPAPASNPAPGVDADLGGTLVQLRDIMLGSLLEDQARAIARLEERVVAQAARLGGELATLVQRLEDRVDALDVRAIRNHGGLGEQVVSQKQGLRSEIEERHTQVTRLVEGGIAQLRDAKFDRAQFSKFLNDLAHHIGSVEHEVEAASGHEARTAEGPGRSDDRTASRALRHSLIEGV